MTQASHLHSPTSLPPSLFSHSQICLHFLLCNKKKLNPFPLPLYLSSHLQIYLQSPLYNKHGLIPSPFLTLPWMKTFLNTLSLITVSSLETS